MLTALCLGFSLLSQDQATVTPAAAISAAFKRYTEAKTLSGRIRWTQSANGVTVVTSTELAYERPSKLLIRQTQEASEKRAWLVTSDGKLFSYDRPETLQGSFGRLVEPVKGPSLVQTIREIYAAASKSLGDKSAILDIAIGRREDLATLRFQWATVTAIGHETIREVECTVVGGKWRESASTAPGGTYQMWISKDGDILRFAQREFFSVPQSRAEPIEVISVWDADLVVNGPVDQKLFTVVR